jgi:hypothetical protein
MRATIIKMVQQGARSDRLSKFAAYLTQKETSFLREERAP